MLFILLSRHIDERFRCARRSARTIAKAKNIDPNVTFLPLAYSLTIDPTPTTTPVGNPPNVLIAERPGPSAPFPEFAVYLALPTIVNPLAIPFIATKCYGVRCGGIGCPDRAPRALENRRGSVLAGICVVVPISALVVNDVLDLVGLPHVSRRFIPFVVTAALYTLPSESRKIIAGIDRK